MLPPVEDLALDMSAGLLAYDSRNFPTWLLARLPVTKVRGVEIHSVALWWDSALDQCKAYNPDTAQTAPGRSRLDKARAVT